MCSCERRKPLQIQGFERNCWINFDKSNAFFQYSMFSRFAAEAAGVKFLRQVQNALAFAFVPLRPKLEKSCNGPGGMVH